MSTPIRGAQRPDWPEQRPASTTPVEATDRARSAMEDPRGLASQAADAAGAATGAARQRRGVGVGPTADADAVAASIIAAEAAARARLATAVKPRTDNRPT